VQLLGLCTTGGPLFIVTEYMPHGNLLDYLRSPQGQAEVRVQARVWVWQGRFAP